jgi:hypothetical protein
MLTRARPRPRQARKNKRTRMNTISGRCSIRGTSSCRVRYHDSGVRPLGALLEVCRTLLLVTSVYAPMPAVSLLITSGRQGRLPPSRAPAAVGVRSPGATTCARTRCRPRALPRAAAVGGPYRRARPPATPCHRRPVPSSSVVRPAPCPVAGGRGRRAREGHGGSASSHTVWATGSWFLRLSISWSVALVSTRSYLQPALWALPRPRSPPAHSPLTTHSPCPRLCYATAEKPAPDASAPYLA